MIAKMTRHVARRLGVVLLAAVLTGCQWRGANSLPLPGTAGRGPNSYTVEAEFADIGTIQRNSRVRVGDVTVGNVIDIQRRGWHAVLTLRLAGDTVLPANATAVIGQTSLLGSMHVQLAPPIAETPEGRLSQGAMLPMARQNYPATAQTLAAVAMLLNGGGLRQVHEIMESMTAALGGREADLRSLLTQMSSFIHGLNLQITDITAAMKSMNRLVGRYADNHPIVDKALRVIPDAIAVLSQNRDNLAAAFGELGKFSAVTVDTLGKSRDALVGDIDNMGPALKGLADAGPALTQSLSFLATIPFPKEQIGNFMRGDYANFTGIFDLTLSRLDAGLLTGTRFEGALTEIEMQWGGTIGQTPSPYTVGNPLIAPYRFDIGR